MKRLLCGLVFLSQVVSAQKIEGETELAGFLLGQYRTAIHNQLGQPIRKKVTEDKWIYEFHRLKADTSVYALFKYPNWDTTRVYSIQVNGDTYTEMHPFYGLKLGDKKEKADRVFGNYDHVKTVDDPPINIQFYKDKNYSVEIDHNGKICGFQIFGSILKTMPKEPKPSLAAFRNAVLSKNIDSLLHYISPDVEFLKQGKVITFKGSAREEFKKENSELVRYLLGPDKSIWSVFAQERAEGGDGKRTHQHTKEILHTREFFDSGIISEIVFTPHAGKWKVYEVKFR